MLWFTSDPHFGHRNIISHCGRPYADVESMHLDLVDRWNRTVGVNDDARGARRVGSR